MKKGLSLFSLFLTFSLLLAGCGGGQAAPQSPASSSSASGGQSASQSSSPDSSSPNSQTASAPESEASPPSRRLPRQTPSPSPGKSWNWSPVFPPSGMTGTTALMAFWKRAGPPPAGRWCSIWRKTSSGSWGWTFWGTSSGAAPSPQTAPMAAFSLAATLTGTPVKPWSWRPTRRRATPPFPPSTWTLSPWGQAA